jgi:cytochrome c oxidase subunit 2
MSNNALKAWFATLLTMLKNQFTRLSIFKLRPQRSKLTYLACLNWGVGLSVALLALLVLPAFALAGPPSPLSPASEEAAVSSDLFWLTFWIAAVIFILVQGALIVAVLRFRETDRSFIPKQIHGNTTLEITWTVIPALILVFLFSMMWQTLNRISMPDEADITISVTGKQWWWSFDYIDEGFVTGNEMHIPVGKTVRLELHSDNVLHSFWVPQLSGKTDLVPGRVNTSWLKADEAGVYRGICAELCGAQHANMTFLVIAEPQEQYEAWVANMQQAPAEPEAGSTAALGQAAFLKGENQCVACHTIEGTIAQSQVGPNLTHVGSRQHIAGLVGFEMNPANLRSWITDPQSHKPLSQMPNLYLPQDELDALVEYLGSLQ